jgi:hypothetical protein
VNNRQAAKTGEAMRYEEIGRQVCEAIRSELDDNREFDEAFAAKCRATESEGFRLVAVDGTLGGGWTVKDFRTGEALASGEGDLDTCWQEHWFSADSLTDDVTEALGRTSRLRVTLDSPEPLATFWGYIAEWVDGASEEECALLVNAEA